MQQNVPAPRALMLALCILVLERRFGCSRKKLWRSRKSQHSHMLHTTQLAKCNAFARAHSTSFRRDQIYSKAEPKAGPCGLTKRVRIYRQGGLIMATANGQQQTLQRDSAPVVVVTTLGCQYCKRAKDALQQAGIPFEEVEAGSQLDLLQTIKKSTGKSTVPQVLSTAAYAAMHCL